MNVVRPLLFCVPLHAQHTLRPIFPCVSHFAEEVTSIVRPTGRKERDTGLIVISWNNFVFPNSHCGTFSLQWNQYFKTFKIFYCFVFQREQRVYSDSEWHRGWGRGIQGGVPYRTGRTEEGMSWRMIANHCKLVLSKKLQCELTLMFCDTCRSWWRVWSRRRKRLSRHVSDADRKLWKNRKRTTGSGNESRSVTSHMNNGNDADINLHRILSASKLLSNFVFHWTLTIQQQKRLR